MKKLGFFKVSIDESCIDLHLNTLFEKRVEIIKLSCGFSVISLTKKNKKSKQREIKVCEHVRSSTG